MHLFESWPGDLLVWVVLGTLSILYARGARRSAHWDERPLVSRRHAAAFVGSVATLIAALLGPIDRLSDVLFSVHMTQHELVMLVGAPLMVLARPLAPILRGLPRSMRRDVTHAFRTPAARRSWGILTSPFWALALHGIVLWAWHLPVLFEAALANEPLHALQHLMMFATAGTFWWAVVHGHYGKAGYGASVLYVFATALHTGLLGAILTFAPRVLYPTYAARTPHPLADQELAGILMWIPAGGLLAAVGLGLFAAWIGESERRAQGRTHARSAS